jgi:hypothetical protein
MPGKGLFQEMGHFSIVKTRIFKERVKKNIRYLIFPDIFTLAFYIPFYWLNSLKSSFNKFL